MPLEDLVGSKYINNLNETWPLGTDLASAGDDHLRGLKNVLKKTFPNLTGPVTRTQDSLNNGSVPVGARLLFYQATAPIGWARDLGVGSFYGLRVIPSSGADSDIGGSLGGLHDPTYNEHIPAHTHHVATNTTNASNTHTHHVEGNTSTESANHTHGFSVNITIPRGLYATGPTVYFGAAQDGTFTVGGSGNTGGQNVSHVHAVVLDTTVESTSHVHGVDVQSGENTGDTSVWQPRYLNVILCYKT